MAKYKIIIDEIEFEAEDNNQAYSIGIDIINDIGHDGKYVIRQVE